MIALSLLLAFFTISQPEPGPAPGYRGLPAIAAAGDRYVAVWAEAEGGTIRGVHLDRNADRIGEPFDIAAADGEVSHLALASNGNDILVAWTVARNTYHRLSSHSSHSSYPSHSSYSSPPPIPGRVRAVIHADGRWLIATAEGFFHILDASGTFLKTIGIGASAFPYATTDGRVAFVWSAAGDIRFAVATVDALLAPGFTAAGPAVLTGGGLIASLAESRGTFAVAIHQIFSSSGTVGTARYRVFDEAGHGAPSSPLPSLVTRAPLLASSGDGFVAVFASDTGYPYGFSFVRIHRSGFLLDERPRQLTGASPVDDPALAEGEGGVVAAWSSEHGIHAERIDAGGTLAHGAPAIADNIISTGLPSIEEALVARCGDELTFAWIERSNYDRLFVRRFHLDGTPRDPAPIRIDAFRRSQYEPSLACGGGAAMVVWREELDSAYVRAAILPEGRTFELGTGRAGAAPAVIWDGTSFLAAWTENNGEIALARITTGGVAGFKRHLLPIYDGVPADDLALAVNAAGELLLARTRDDSGRRSVYAVRVSRELNIVDETVLSVSAATAHHDALSIAAGPETWMVTWSERLHGHQLWTHHASRLARSGTPIDVRVASPVGTPSPHPRIRARWNGCAFELATAPLDFVPLDDAALPPGSSGSSGSSEGLLDLQSPRGTPRNSEEPRGTRSLVLTTDGHQLIARIDPSGCASTRRRATGR